MEIENKPKNYSKIVKVAVFGVALIITGTIVFQGNFLEGVLKLIGAGASETIEIVISSVDDFRGEGDYWVNNNVELENVTIVNSVSGIEDPTLIGLVIPKIGVNIQQVDEEAPKDTKPAKSPKKEKSDTPENPEPTEYMYTSPVVNFGSGSTLRSFTTLDYRPVGSEIVYAYRTSATTNMSGNFINIEDTSNNAPYPNSLFIEHTSLQELPIPQYLQFKITFINVNPDDLSAVATFKIAYQPDESDVQVDNTVSWGDMTKGNSQIAKELAIDYNELSIDSNEMGSVRINVASNGKEIAKLNKIILANREKVVFEDIELKTGEEYVIVLEMPGYDIKILYFAASFTPEDSYNFTFGRFYRSSGTQGRIDPRTSSADLNGDGDVNAIDYALFIEAFGSSNL